jgi:RND family efflux transporter MFP subunit
MQANTRHRALIVVAVLGVIGLAAAAFTMTAGPGVQNAIPSAPVKRGSVRITLSETGELRAEHQATIQATNDKMIVWLAPEGSWVEQGDLLVQLDSSKYEIQRSGANSGLEMARAELEAAYSALEGQKNAERQAELEYEKLPALAEKGFINQTEVETARLAYEKVRSARRSYEAAVVAAKANVDRAEGEVNQSQRKYDLGAIVAPREGLVVYAHVGAAGSNRKIQVGMTPFEGMDLMYLPDLNSMIVETEVSEVDVSRVRVGSPALIRLDAYPDLSFDGEVTLISGLARPKISRVTGKPTGLKVFDVTVKVTEADERLKPGLSATTDILVSQHEDALYIPIAAVFLDELDQTVAYVRRLGGAEARPISIADTSDRVAIVTEGLEDGDEVLLEAPVAL